MTNNTLIAIMNSKADFEIAMQEGWYRIPAGTKTVPLIVRDRTVHLIAFYHTAVFEQEKFSIRFFARVKKISIVKRKDLLFPPSSPIKQVEYDIKANRDYYKVEFSTLNKLSQPILSRKHRRILFIPTTDQKLFNSSEINFLFNDSPLEEALWQKLVIQNITAERQYLITEKEKAYLLDFALFCKTRNIDIECDGDQYHTSKQDVYSDKKRNNFLESRGWSVLRFTPEDIYTHPDQTLNVIKEAANKYGGIENDNSFTEFRYLRKDGDHQLKLF